MNDKPLFALLRSILVAEFALLTGYENIEVARKNQPRQQGRTQSPTVYMSKISDRRYGSPKRRDRYSTLTQNFDHAEEQVYETRIQFSVWVKENPQDVTGLTGSDMLSAVAAIMQSDKTVAALIAQGVGVQRIIEAPNPYFVDDQDQFLADPSVDVIFTHTRSLVTTIPAVDTYEARISRV